MNTFVGELFIPETYHEKKPSDTWDTPSPAFEQATMNTKNDKEIMSEFTEKFIEYIPKYNQESGTFGAGSYITHKVEGSEVRDWLKTTLAQVRKEEQEAVIELIKSHKEAIQRTGTFKYDSCYDDLLASPLLTSEKEHE